MIKQARLDQLTFLEGLISNKKRATGRKKLPKSPRPKDPRHLSRQYIKIIKPMMDAQRALVEALLIPQLERILREAAELRPTQNSENSRLDSLSSNVGDVMGQIEINFLRRFPRSEVENLALDALVKINKSNLDDYDRIFGSVLGIQLPTTEPWFIDAAGAFVKQNADLFTSVTVEARGQIEQTVMRMVQEGKLQKDIAAEIKNRLGVSESRANLIARDQASKFNAQLSKLRQTEVGLEKYEWSTSGDERVRQTHAANNNKTFYWNDPPATEHPGEDVNCRCVAIPVFE